MIDGLKNMMAKLFKKTDSNKFEFNIVVLTPEQIEYRIADSGIPELRNIGFKIGGGKYKGIVVRLNNIIELPSMESDKGGDIPVQFDYNVVDVSGTKFNIDQLNDDNSDATLEFIPTARAIFHEFVAQSIEYAASTRRNKNEQE